METVKFKTLHQEEFTEYDDMAFAMGAERYPDHPRVEAGTVGIAIRSWQFSNIAQSGMACEVLLPDGRTTQIHSWKLEFITKDDAERVSNCLRASNYFMKKYVTPVEPVGTYIGATFCPIAGVIPTIDGTQLVVDKKSEFVLKEVSEDGHFIASHNGVEYSFTHYAFDPTMQERQFQEKV